MVSQGNVKAGFSNIIQRRKDDGKIVFPLQSFLNDFRAQKSQEAAPEALAQSGGCILLINESS